jgi:ribosome biogenesis GTPase
MEGLVIKSTGSWYDVKADTGDILKCRVRGKLKMKGMKVTNPVAVGDQVVYELEADGNGIIHTILPRTNYLIRRSTRKTAFGHILASNIDLAVVIATLTFPKTSLGFIDRFLISAESFRIPSLLVFNKTDMWTKEAFQIRRIFAQYL